MASYSDRLVRLQFKDAVREKLARHRNKSIGASTQTAKSAEQKISTPLAYVEGLDDLSIKVSRLPLGPTESHIEGMLAVGSLAKENLFVGPDRWQEFSKNAKVPQAMGYKIAELAKANNVDPAELAECIITDKETLGQALAIIREGSDVTMYVGNHEFNEAWLGYLGKRRPTHKEQLAVWEKLPGRNVLEKATKAGIPFSGYFDADDRQFYDVGSWLYLLSSSQYESGFESLGLYRSSRDEHDGWSNPQRGYSSFAVEDKK